MRSLPGWLAHELYDLEAVVTPSHSGCRCRHVHARATLGTRKMTQTEQRGDSFNSIIADNSSHAPATGRGSLRRSWFRQDLVLRGLSAAACASTWASVAGQRGT